MNEFPVFCHVDEFEQGLESLPLQIALSDPVTLWSPSWKLLAEKHARGKTYLGPRDLLNLMGRGEVRIMGREAWLTDPDARKVRGAGGDLRWSWPGAEWTSEDDEVARNWMNDPAVLVAQDETGYEQADAEIDLSGDGIVDPIIDLLDPRTANRLPRGIVEKVERKVGAFEHYSQGTGRRKAAREVLRDYFNHWDAARSCGSRACFTPGGQLELVAHFLGSSSAKPTDPGLGESGKEELAEAVDLLKGLSALRDLGSLHAFLDSGLRAELRQFLFGSGAKNHRESLPQRVGNEIRSVLGSVSPNPAFGLVSVAGLVLSIGSMLLSPDIVDFCGFNVSFFSLLEERRKLACVPDAYPDLRGHQALFLASTGEHRPGLAKIRQVIDGLDRMARA